MWDVTNCRGVQVWGPHKCKLTGKGVLSEERLKQVCGCQDILLQCHLVAWIKGVKEVLVPDLLKDKEWKLEKFKACPRVDCDNQNRPYENTQRYKYRLI